MNAIGLNLRGALAIFNYELIRFFRTVFGSILSPVLTTSLYFIVFGAAIGRQMDPSQFGGVSYGAFIVPGLLMWDPLESTCRHASLSIL